MLEGLQSMARPIPGQSLTNDPNDPAPYEKAPKHTNLRQAQEDVFGKLTQEDVYVPIMSTLAEGDMDIMTITQNLLYAGFRNGQWNPDLMIMLAEPTAYMIMALAERANIDYEIDSEPTIENDEGMQNGRLGEMQKAMESKDIKKTIPKGAIPKEIEDRLDEAPVESLLAKPKDSGPVEENLEGGLLDAPQ